MSDSRAEEGIAIAALVVAIGVGLIMNHWVEDIWLCIGVGMLTFMASGIGLTLLVAWDETRHERRSEEKLNGN